MRTIKRVLDGRVLIRMVDVTTKSETSGLTFEDDGASLPIAQIVLVGKNIDQVEVGDLVHYTVARESGKTSHKGEPHYIVPVSNVVAVLEDE